MRQVEVNYLNQMETNPFPKYYSIKFPRMDIDSQLNVIAVEKDLKKQMGTPKSIKIQNRETLLIEVHSEAQGNKIKKIKKLNNNDVVVAEHTTLNQSKGTLISEAMANSTNEELLEATADQKVIKIERMKMRKDGRLVDSNRFIVTFDKPDLPPILKLTSWKSEFIDPYIPKPMRCLNCQRFGHTKKHCRRPNATCYNCGEDGHTKPECEVHPPRCVNCGGEHTARDRNCPFYVFKC